MPGYEAQAPVNDTTNVKETTVQWVTDRAWISGLVGALTVVLLAYWYHKWGILGSGLQVFGLSLTDNRLDSILAALVIIAGVMVLVETVRLRQWQGDEYLSWHPQLKAGRYSAFLVNVLINYGLTLLLLWLVLQFFRSAGEYGFNRGADYYQAWFRFLEWVWAAYLWAGLPYALVTRALKYDPQADSRDMGYFLGRLLSFLLYKVWPFAALQVELGEQDKKNARALLVKLFFTPLMTVFFVSQFPHLVNNIGYLLTTLPNAIAGGVYQHVQFNNDLFNIGIALIFSIDVALAWCGSTMLGWLVCVVCYPPFQMFLGLYYGAPGERDVLQFGNQWVITVFAVMMVLSYLVYMAATLWFGVRFSNLTHRGIIRKGPFAYIRHPAYASKNFAWWCVMFPAIVYNATTTGIEVAVMQTMGLVLMTWVYYLRAMTEEKHLGVDPQYQEYCRQVKYRFIPGVI